MGRKKKSGVCRCNACGVKATKHIAGELYVCNNMVCEQLTWEYISTVLEQEEKGSSNEPSN